MTLYTRDALRLLSAAKIKSQKEKRQHRYSQQQQRRDEGLETHPGEEEVEGVITRIMGQWLGGGQRQREARAADAAESGYEGMEVLVRSPRGEHRW